jgi:hypothetical protein
MHGQSYLAGQRTRSITFTRTLRSPPPPEATLSSAVCAAVLVPEPD